MPAGDLLERAATPGIVVRISKWYRHPLSKVVRYMDSPELECFHRIGLVTDHKKGI